MKFFDNEVLEFSGYLLFSRADAGLGEQPA
jgi:hypothetical protein